MAMKTYRIRGIDDAEREKIDQQALALRELRFAVERYLKAFGVWDSDLALDRATASGHLNAQDVLDTVIARRGAR